VPPAHLREVYPADPGHLPRDGRQPARAAPPPLAPQGRHRAPRRAIYSGDVAAAPSPASLSQGVLKRVGSCSALTTGRRCAGMLCRRPMLGLRRWSFGRSINQPALDWRCNSKWRSRRTRFCERAHLEVSSPFINRALGASNPADSGRHTPRYHVSDSRGAVGWTGNGDHRFLRPRHFPDYARAGEGYRRRRRAIVALVSPPVAMATGLRALGDSRLLDQAARRDLRVTRSLCRIPATLRDCAERVSLRSFAFEYAHTARFLK